MQQGTSTASMTRSSAPQNRCFRKALLHFHKRHPFHHIDHPLPKFGGGKGSLFPSLVECERALIDSPMSSGAGGAIEAPIGVIHSNHQVRLWPVGCDVDGRLSFGYLQAGHGDDRPVPLIGLKRFNSHEVKQLIVGATL